MFTFKAFWTKYGATEPEIRRFSVSEEVSGDFDNLQQKIAEIFKELSIGSFVLFWKDNEDDTISISSAEELTEAVKYAENNVLRVYIKDILTLNAEHKLIAGEHYHEGVTCDGCEGSIYGARYKCIVCPDYNLCQKCEKAGNHLEHDMMKLMRPVQNETDAMVNNLPFGVYLHNKKQMKRLKKMRKCKRRWGLLQGEGMGPFGAGPGEEAEQEGHFGFIKHFPYRRRWKCKRHRGRRNSHGESSGSEGLSQDSSDPTEVTSEDIAEMMEPLSITKENVKRRKVTGPPVEACGDDRCGRRNPHCMGDGVGPRGCRRRFRRYTDDSEDWCKENDEGRMNRKCWRRNKREWARNFRFSKEAEKECDASRAENKTSESKVDE